MNYLALKKKARNFREGFIGEGLTFSTAFYVLLDKEGNFLRRGNQACSSSLIDFADSHSAFLLYSIDRATTKSLGVCPEIYYDWLFKESAWAEAFVTKTYRTAIKHGVEIDVSAPYNVMYQATIALRIWEYPSIYKTMITFMKKGIEGQLAMYLSYRFNAKEGFVSTRGDNGGGHLALDIPHITHSKEAFTNFLTKKTYASLPYNAGGHKGRPGNFTVFNRGNREQIGVVDNPRGMASKETGFLEDTAEGASLNIFNKLLPNSMRKKITLDAFVSKVNNCQDIYKELIHG